MDCSSPTPNPPQGSPVLLSTCWNQTGTWGKRDCPELPAHGHCRNCPTYAAAAARMLDRPVPENYAEEWTRRFAEAKPALARDTRAVVVFRIHTEWFALPVPVLGEIVERRPVHSLPPARASFIKGVVNIRGQLLICISLSRLLRLTDRVATKAPHTTFERLLVMRTDTGPFVFPVSEVFGLCYYRPCDVREVPTTVARGSGRFTHALLHLQVPSGKTPNRPPAHLSAGLLNEQLLARAITRGLT